MYDLFFVLCYFWLANVTRPNKFYRKLVISKLTLLESYRVSGGLLTTSLIVIIDNYESCQWYSLELTGNKRSSGGRMCWRR